MARKYEMKRRAERQEQTRRRIVEAAVELHAEVGPARTTPSAIAERAGVERRTYYRHFPEQHSLLLECSGLFFELNPLPDADAWRAIEDPDERLRRGLAELYDYYARNESLIANVTRDEEVHPPTREANLLRVGPRMAAIRDALADGLAAGRNRRAVLAVLDVALDFRTWRTLVRTNRLRRKEAIDVMARAAACIARPS
jgi:AcrR family transcriptional regulator